jgi:hypothetical protein
MQVVPARRLTPFLALLLALAGCGTTNMSGATAEADSRAAGIIADCDAQLRSGKPSSYRQAAECAHQPVLLVYAQAGYPYMDLVLFDLQERELGAERIDYGSAKPADVQHDIAILEQRLLAERERRIAARTGIGGAAPAMPAGQLIAGLNSLQPTPAPTQDTSCFKIGDFSRCNNQPAPQ